MHSQAMPTLDINYKNEQGEVAQMVNKISSHPSVVRYGWGNEYCQRPNRRGLSCLSCPRVMPNTLKVAR